MERQQAEALVNKAYSSMNRDDCGDDHCNCAFYLRDILIHDLIDPEITVDRLTDTFFAQGAVELARAMEQLHKKPELDAFASTYGYENWPKFVHAVFNRAKRMFGGALPNEPICIKCRKPQSAHTKSMVYPDQLVCP